MWFALRTRYVSLVVRRATIGAVYGSFLATGFGIWRETVHTGNLKFGHILRCSTNYR